MSKTEFVKNAINEALALFNRRWVLRVIWELRAGALTFRALQAACDDISPTVLNQRLAELREAELVVLDSDGFRLTSLGADLVRAFAPLTQWAVHWKQQRGG